MTIRKGEAWGVLQRPTPGLVTVASDDELRQLVIAASAAGTPMPVVGLLGGDLMRTLGGSGDASRLDGSEAVPHLPIDVVTVRADDSRETTFVAHLVARPSTAGGRWWRGPLFAAMNAQFLGRWDVSPRCHPNDGRVDVVHVDPAFGVQQRWQARRRLPLGTHVPHPLITIRQHSSTTVQFGRRMPLWIDGRRWGSASSVELRVHPDACTVCV